MATLHLPRFRPGSRTGGEDESARTLQTAFWTVAGAIVVLYIFFAALGGIDPAEARAATIVVLVLAVLWLAHSWRRLWAEEKNLGSRSDRERRGF